MGRGWDEGVCNVRNVFNVCNVCNGMKVEGRRSEDGRLKTESAPQAVAVNVEYFTQAKISKVS